MDRRVQVRRPPHSPLTAVYSDPPPGLDLDKLAPNFLMTRIWMGVVPPEAERQGGVEKVHPGYACVVGEVYDANPQERHLPKIVLDEAVALNPADFNEEEIRRFRLTDKEYRYPTLFSLQQAIIALKDIWWPSQVLVPPETALYETLLFNTDGLCQYEERLGERLYQSWHPFFKSKRRVAQGIIKVEHENRAYNEGLIDALMGRDLLEVYTDCTILLDEQTPPARRAAGLVLAQMEKFPQWQQIRQRENASFDESPEETRLRGWWNEQGNEYQVYIDNLKELFGVSSQEDSVDRPAGGREIIG